MTTTSHRPNSDDAVIHSPPMELGDVASTPPDPLLTPPFGTPEGDRGGDVLMNHSKAALPEGARCITIMNGAQTLTPAEAARLARDLADTAKVAADERTLRGYDE